MIIKAIILGIIEGLTEFLPVSSTGHLIIANKYLNFTGDFANSFAIIIQVGAILAVMLYFKDKVFPKLDDKRRLIEYFSLWTKVAVGVLPAVILGLLKFDDYVDEHFFNPTTVAIALIFGAILLLLGEKGQKKTKVVSEKHISYKQAFIVGIAQCMAVIPGMSRSASTIIGGLFIGFSRKVAAEFSFFLAIPTLIGAAILKIYKMGLDFTSYEWLILAVGTFVSFIVAYLVIAFFMNYIKKRKLTPFAYYRIILGIIVLLVV
ncbi:undecaprenyl-diphosphate phosphatase [Paramaledivibacter caminithermalis]|jgi:undecaprenyl-diphosphatase|uniref:Undecaprenyl-diphosphatase n=1 Tax=Paramaledivibacter caminithermalis (strain DSM 15212 / CIP 107654 / DViRD3) TaxID=1121301 RepID=A0A1M6MKY6_PARC5|nr:undecaprenyl-diphosphate phosphatase [Paramaledivibacter caminithermalis]SHJ84040.1 undecaprenyl-diphosphatase [Paramaledivibacter caminithermalis DSM 15212]